MTFKKTLLSLVIAAGALGLSAQELGGPVVNGKAWGWSLGGGYDYWSHEVRLVNRNNSTNDPYTMWSTGQIYVGDTVKLATHRVFLDAGVNLGRNWQVKTRAGIGKVSAPSGLDTYMNPGNPFDGQQFDGNNTGFVGLSFRGTFVRGEKFSLGLVGSGNLFGNIDQSRNYTAVFTIPPIPPSTTPTTVTGTGTYFTSITGYRDGAVALAFEFKMGNAALYGGPLYNRHSGRLNISNTASALSGTTVYSFAAAPVRTHFMTNSTTGAYLGVRLPASGDWTSNLEASYRDKSVNVGFSFSYHF